LNGKTRGVLWGRFNPPHTGHIALIEGLAKQVDSLTVAVGSAEQKNTRRNPFSGNERVKMLKSYLKERKVEVRDVVAVDDGSSWASSIDGLFQRCGRFDILFTDRKRIARLVGNRVKVVGFSRRGRVSSTMIRDSIARGDDKWRRLTGRSVTELIDKIDGEDRIRRAYGLRVTDNGLA
jgi:nicotinamide-nucleotide adenylyltransferase